MIRIDKNINLNKLMCFLKFKRRFKTIRVYEQMTYEEFYVRFKDVLMPGVSLERFIRANRYRRLVNPIIRPGNYVTIPRIFA